jgi:hypothetical protein
MDMLNYDSLYHHNRNYGCRYHDIEYMGFRSIILENELLRVLVMYEKGTDIVEFVYKPKDIDFMWRSPAEVSANKKNLITKEHPAGAFLDEYEGGWQELLPNINNPTNYKGASLGFHGEAYLRAWDYRVLVDTVKEVKIRFSVRLNRAPFFVTKTVTIKSYAPAIEFEESILNEGDEEFKFTWGHHPAIGIPFLSDKCVIDLPQGTIGRTYDKDFSGNSIFPPDVEFFWPFVKDKNGKEIDLSRVMPPELKTAFCVSLENLNNGWYGITNPDIGVGFGMKWDIKVFKYLWMWVVCRGFYNFPFYGRTYNIALEPWSAIPDNLDDVIKAGRELTLQPKEILETKFTAIVYESDSRIKGFNENNRVIKL